MDQSSKQQPVHLSRTKWDRFWIASWRVILVLLAICLPPGICYNTFHFLSYVFDPATQLDMALVTSTLLEETFYYLLLLTLPFALILAPIQLWGLRRDTSFLPFLFKAGVIWFLLYVTAGMFLPIIQGDCYETDRLGYVVNYQLFGIIIGSMTAYRLTHGSKKQAQ